ncbi:tRNA (guanosine(37)-N1)-methyltransferase TrmD [Candidatus Curtissbacteria bacterium RBG_13_40_7]|uniref:tRNA (guanine-N(1)-)-methyltransferase n=1 Tax=Candidatus Curtissbacteria bacterium RBG_13_40_7 TaxID=1797706 RepID=A0A1F5FUB2_9BACT|nr:MAG: tRNA (guanosine(37)-N1)-methyltransferase TrmD [Candidatus Curtissbacteria bacterium RBG_13_40_7]
MTFYILTLFPQMFKEGFSQSIIAQAKAKQLINIYTLNIRNFGYGARKNVDDKPYGGGKGMILRVDVIVQALKSLNERPYTVLLSASGNKYNQKTVKLFSTKQSLALICGHYEGVDARIEKYVDEVVSIGDFVLTGGEIAALAIVDSVTRLIPGVIHPESLKSESFSQVTRNQLPATILEYPQYTRPEEFEGLKVPKILLSGNHKEIIKWRTKQQIKRTKKFRPDLIRK